jgi:prepilin-type N-terminal cleavage/methylation domain-containing protein
MNSPKRNSHGFTFVELLVSTLVAAVAAAGAYSLLDSGLSLYAKNFSLNATHYTARVSLERMMPKINSSGAAPILVDEKGADIAGNGPAAGIRLCVPPANSSYTIPTAVAATATSLNISIAAGQARPRDSDVLLIDAGVVLQSGKAVQVEIASVSGTGSPVTLTLKEAVGSAIPANSRCLILQQIAFIASANQLHFYPKVMSEARQGAAAFTNPANYTVISTIEPTPGNTQPRPFLYKDATRRLLSVDLRNRATRFSNQISKFNTFFSIHSSIAVRSAYLDSSKLKPIN